MVSPRGLCSMAAQGSWTSWRINYSKAHAPGKRAPAVSQPWESCSITSTTVMRQAVPQAHAGLGRRKRFQLFIGLETLCIVANFLENTNCLIHPRDKKQFTSFSHIRCTFLPPRKLSQSLIPSAHQAQVQCPDLII